MLHYLTTKLTRKGIQFAIARGKAKSTNDGSGQQEIFLKEAKDLLDEKCALLNQVIEAYEKEIASPTPDSGKPHAFLLLQVK